MLRSLRIKTREIGFRGVNTPEEYGGMNLGAVMSAILAMGRPHIRAVHFGRWADNILYAGTQEQRRRYLVPTSRAKGSHASP